MSTYSNLLENENPSSLHINNELIETIRNLNQGNHYFFNLCGKYSFFFKSYFIEIFYTGHFSQQQSTSSEEEISVILSQTIERRGNPENLNEFSFLSPSTKSTINTNSTVNKTKRSVFCPLFSFLYISMIKIVVRL